MAFEITPIKITPSSVPHTVPSPPLKLVPPMMTEAITSNSQPRPKLNEAANNWPEVIKPESAANICTMMKQMTLVAPTLMPLNRADSGLPPVAYTERPMVV